MLGVVGRKCGMTRVFTPEGRSIPVSVIEVLPNLVTQIKTQANDGYEAIQVTTGTRRASRVTKPMAGHFSKAAVEPGRGLWEFRLEGTQTTLVAGAEEEAADKIKVGSQLTVALFKEGQEVDVTGTSKGKGFSSAIKVWGFRTQDNSHGNSLSHRAPGSIGQNQSPGRVFPGKKMAKQLGNVRRTVQSLRVVKIDEARNLLLVAGAIPGAVNGDILVRPAVKAKKDEAKS